MGVMPCQRENCHEIMCDRLLNGRYICNECLAELEAWRTTWPDTTRVSDVANLIERFLASPKGRFVLSNDSCDAEDVEKEFRRRIGE